MVVPVLLKSIGITLMLWAVPLVVLIMNVVSLTQFFLIKKS